MADITNSEFRYDAALPRPLRLGAILAFGAAVFWAPVAFLKDVTPTPQIAAQIQLEDTSCQ